MIRTMLKYKLIIIGMLCIVFGCARVHVKTDTDSKLHKGQVATIKVNHRLISITEVDNSFTKVNPLKTLWYFNESAEKANVKPGVHDIELDYNAGQSRYYIELNALSGHSYIVKHFVKDNSVALWIEDEKTKEHCGKVLASINEPIIDYNEKLEHSYLFALLPPQEDDWVIVYKDISQISLAKKGNDKDETYAISVTMVEIPNIDTEYEFMDFVAKSRDKDTDTKRFKILKDDTNIYKLRADYCVSYHTIAEDNKAVKHFMNKKPMLVEMVGYTCRYPLNRNMVINFDYSHRYYPGNGDEKLLEKANKVFSQLEF